MAKVLVVGSVNPEFVFRFHPTGRSKERAYDYSSALGGTAYNVTSHLVRLRGTIDVCPQFLVGSDMAGALAHDKLASVAGEPLWWRPKTAIAVIELPDVGKHRVLGFKVAAQSSPDRLDKIRDTLTKQKPKVIFVAGLIDGEEWIASELFTKAEGAVRVFTPDIAACQNGSLDAVLAATDFLIVNEEEACAFFHITDVVAEASTIRARTSAAVVITRAERGAVMIPHDGEVIQVPAPSAVRVTQPVGAGDAFIATFLANLRPDIAYRELLAAAVAAGTRHVAGEAIAAA